MEDEEHMTTEEKRKKMVEGIVSAPADAVEKVYDEVGQSLRDLLEVLWEQLLAWQLAVR